MCSEPGSQEQEVTGEGISWRTCHRLIEFMQEIPALVSDQSLSSEDGNRLEQAKVAEFRGYLGSLVDDELGVLADADADESRRAFIESLRRSGREREQ